MAGYWDRYGRGATVCHRWPIEAKLGVVTAITVVALLIPVEHWPLFGVLLAVVFVGHSLARIPLAYLMRRLAFFLPLVLMLGATIPAAEGFSGGWETMWLIVFRSVVTFLALVWLVSVAPFDLLLATLNRYRCPPVLTATMACMYRYVYVLWDELGRMQTARRARTFKRLPRWRQWYEGAQLIGMLLLRAFGRAERVHGAMLARGFAGRVRFFDTRLLREVGRESGGDDDDAG
ncbi:MAG: hypothetical protein D6725_05575 [Planctomycetota bacterium]|nr:MAG: hypothetical protein D6725_05575 [Planctomycetota bacterium]